MRAFVQLESGVIGKVVAHYRDGSVDIMYETSKKLLPNLEFVKIHGRIKAVLEVEDF